MRRQEAKQRREQFLKDQQVVKKDTKGMSQKEKMAYQQERFMAQQQQAREEWIREKQILQQTMSSQQTEVTQSSTQSQYQEQQVTKKASTQYETIEQLPFSQNKQSTAVKSRQQLEKERDEIIQQTINRYKIESQSLSDRIRQEEDDRQKMLLEEQNRADREAEARQKILKQEEEERARKVKEEKERLKQMEAERLKRIEEHKKKNELQVQRRLAENQAAKVEEQRVVIKRSFESQTKSIEEKKQIDVKALEEKRRQEAQSLINQQKLLEQNTAGGQVTRRSDDMHGLGFGQVKTGHVITKKISFLQRASSLEPDASALESPAPKKRMVRFAGLDSPASSPSPISKAWQVRTGVVAGGVAGWGQFNGTSGHAETSSRRAISEVRVVRVAGSPSL